MNLTIGIALDAPPWSVNTTAPAQGVQRDNMFRIGSRRNILGPSKNYLRVRRLPYQPSDRLIPPIWHWSVLMGFAFYAIPNRVVFRRNDASLFGRSCYRLCMTDFELVGSQRSDDGGHCLGCPFSSTTNDLVPGASTCNDFRNSIKASC